MQVCGHWAGSPGMQRCTAASCQPGSVEGRRSSCSGGLGLHRTDFPGCDEGCRPLRAGSPGVRQFNGASCQQGAISTSAAGPQIVRQDTAGRVAAAAFALHVCLGALASRVARCCPVAHRAQAKPARRLGISTPFALACTLPRHHPLPPVSRTASGTFSTYPGCPPSAAH